MGKFESMMTGAGANIAESMGGTRLQGGMSSTPAPTPSFAGVPVRLQGVAKMKGAVEIPVEKIHRDPNQPREEFEEEGLKRLAESLRAKGQLQPIRVRWDEGQGGYLIVCGERRWRAARMAGLATLGAVVIEGEIDAGELLAVQLIENCLREDLRPIEQARAYRALMESKGWSIRQLAAELALDHSGVAKALTLLELPPAVQAEVDQGNLLPTTAYELTKIPDSVEQEELARRAVVEKLTGAKVKEEIRARKDPRPRPKRLEWKAPGGVVVAVTLPDPNQGEDAALEALQAVAKLIRKARTSRTEAA
jgi:ParB family transcriptional regulator, chromosome partitioning protein